MREGTPFFWSDPGSAERSMKGAFLPSAALAFLGPLLTSTMVAETPTEERKVVAVRVDEPPSLDGTFADAWTKGGIVSRFLQREPFEGRAASEKTTVSVLYDRHNLYFGVRCSDGNPEGIVATELRRDADYTVDDHFTILISPENDGRNGYTFTVNPLGTQFDALITDGGRIKDPNWDGVWRSNAAIDSGGWTATIAIPFSTLNFKTSRNVTLGINFRRFIRRKNEEDLWRAYLRIHGLERISQSGELTGLDEIGSGRLLILKPYGLGGFERQDQADTQVEHSAGFDGKLGIRTNLVANLTINTDFADADVDPVRFNLTPFRISLPEKRPFFLENGGAFQFGFQDQSQVFFSRQIGIDPVSGQEVGIDAGAKITGALGPFNVGLLDVHTRAGGSNPSANYLVARIKHRLFAESYVGAIGIDKESSNTADRYNRTFGVDGILRLFDRLTLAGLYAKTSSDPEVLHGRDWAAFGQALYNSNLVQAELRHAIVQPNFNPEVGFVDRTNLVTDFVDLNLSPRPKTGPVREFDFEGFYLRQPDTAGVLQTREWMATFRANFHNGSYTDDDLVDAFYQRLTTPFNIFGNVFIPPGEYRFVRHQLTYGSDQSRRFVVRLFERFGSFYSGRLNEVRVRLSYRPNPRLSIALNEGWDRFRLPALYNVHVGSLNTSYSFSRFLNTSCLVQWDSVDPRALSLSLRLRLNYRLDSDVFVVYNVGNQFGSLEAGNPVVTRGQRLVVKATYSFVK